MTEQTVLSYNWISLHFFVSSHLSERMHSSLVWIDSSLPFNKMFNKSNICFLYSCLLWKTLEKTNKWSCSVDQLFIHIINVSELQKTSKLLIFTSKENIRLKIKENFWINRQLILWEIIEQISWKVNSNIWLISNQNQLIKK